MKRLLIIAAVVLASNYANAQTFHFIDTSTTLVKNTDQSPAHWYLEIYNDAGVDTMLRWKAEFQNIPAQWNVQLDDQDNLTTNIQDGDSADFTLFTGLAFPQKLIIGVTFNGVPGSGSVYFDIYDPDNPTVVQRIQYRFIVSAVSLDELEGETWIQQVENKIIFDDKLVGSEVNIYSESGQLIYRGEADKEMSFDTLSYGQLFFVSIEFEGTLYRQKFIYQ